MDLLPIFYGGVFIVSMALAAIYILMWHKHFDANFNMVFTLIPVACLGYLFSSLATGRDTAILAQKVIYIGGSFLQLFILFSILNLCRIGLPRWSRLILFSLSAVVYASVLSIGYSDIFYRTVAFSFSAEEGPVLTRTYGFMHTAFYVLLLLYLLGGLGVIIYSWVRKKEVPRRILVMLVFPDIICVLAYFIVLKVLGMSLDLVPVGYVLAEITYLLIAHRVNLYDVSDTVIDSMAQERGLGYLSVDFSMRYLGSNAVAKQLVPALNEIAVDESLGYRPSIRKIRHHLDAFRRDPKNNSFVIHVNSETENPEDDRYFVATVSDLYDGPFKRGYIVAFLEDTSNQKYIRLMNTYNENLQRDVDEKTRHIVEMHDHLILSLATMVESRDNSTGGHIRRTSEGVRILIDELLKEGRLSLTPEFCRNMIKAAPMHDLGKIAVPDRILQKPGRFTDEEYAAMKTHAAEGARVIHQVLEHTDDEQFKVIAENVAHYHHERWDGSGYPDRLAGERIPLEARIMAIADVYDALVSKRIYKQAFDFEKANRIMMEGMGSQFDPGLESAYVEARPRLEAYYASLPEA